MSKIKLQIGDYVVHDEMTLEQYERFHEESLNQGYKSYGNRAAKERYGDSHNDVTFVEDLGYIMGTSLIGSSRTKRDVTEYFTQEQQQEPTDSTMSMNIYTSIDTVTMDGNHVSYSLMLEGTMNSPLTWMTAMDEFVKLLQQGGYIIDDENLAEYFNSKLAEEPKNNCGGHF